MNIVQTQILVADDDPVYREVAREELEKAGHAVTVAVDGAEAIACLNSQFFDAAIVDLTMPKADGIAVIEAALANGPNVNTPFIVITGHDDTTAVDRAYKAGAKSFLTKPLNWVLFTPHINFVLRSGQIESELRETTAAAAFLSDLKSQMMAAMAREFQQPIKTIFSCSELIRQEAFGPISPTTYREMAVDMGGAAQRLNASFLKLMDLGNALVEQLSLKVETIPVAETLSNIIASQTDAADRRHVRIESNIRIGNDVTVDVDKVLFMQAVRSIVSNAVKLAPRGSTVEARASIGADGSLQIGATDNGPAISAALLAEIKRQPAQRPEIAIDSESRDVGIKIAKVLTEAHSGRLDVQAEPSGANLVRLEFPASLVKGPETRASVAHTAAPPPDEGVSAQVSFPEVEPIENKFAAPTSETAALERRSQAIPPPQRPAAGTDMVALAERLAAISRTLAVDRRPDAVQANGDTIVGTPASRPLALDAASLRRRLAAGDAK